MKIADLQTNHRRRANFTPMIDVVFLLLIFFMMISRFGDSHALPLALAHNLIATLILASTVRLI